MAESYTYEKFDVEKGKKIDCPQDDKDGSVTGHIVLNVKAWFDENPEERKRLGWIKHIRPGTDSVEYNPQTQFIVTTTKQLDEYTVIDEYKVLDKSEEQLAFEEMLSVADWGGEEGGFRFF